MLNNWFSNKDTKLINFYQNLNENSLGSKVNFLESIKDIEKNDLILFSDQPELHKSIIQELYEHDNPFKFVKIFDLGVIEELPQEDFQRAISTLFSIGARIISLQGNQDLQSAIFNYLNSLSSPYKAMRIAPRTVNPKNLPLSSCKQFVEFGIQGHLCNINKRYNDVFRVRLASIKRDISENELFCRDKEYVILDCSSVKHQDFPGHKNCGPAGLTAEELTRIFRYLGFNNRLRAITIKGYDAKQDFNRQGAKLIAQCIWYYINAYNECIKENIYEEDYTEYIVDISESNEHLTFRQGKKSLRWWLKDSESDTFIPCSYNDYQSACNNEIPNRLFF